MLVSYLVLFLGVSVLDCKARYSFNVLEGSRVVLLTDFFNSSSRDVEKLHASLKDRDLADVDLVLLQRDGPSSFHGSFNALSRGKDRSLQQVTDKELLSLLLVKKPNTLISVTQNTDIPQILISAWRKGLLPFTKEVVIWMTQGNAEAVSGANRITLTSPGNFDSQSSLLDANHFASRKTHFISARNLESAVVEVLQRRKSDVPRRERRAALASAVAPTSSSKIVIQLTASPSATVSSASKMASTSSSKIAVQPTASPSATVSSASGVVSTSSSNIVVQPTASPTVTVSSASKVASTSSSEIAVQPTASPSATVSSASGVVSTSSSNIAVQPTASHTVTVSSASKVASTIFSEIAVQPTASPSVTVSSASWVASTGSSKISVQLTSSPSKTVSSASQVVSTGSSEIAVQPTASPSATVSSASKVASTSSSEIAIQPTASPSVTVSSASKVASTSSSKISVQPTASPSVTVSSAIKVSSPSSSEIVVQPTASPSGTVSSASRVTSTSSSEIAVLPTLSPSAAVSSASKVASTSSSEIAVLPTLSPSVAVSSASRVASSSSSRIASESLTSKVSVLALSSLSLLLSSSSLILTSSSFGASSTPSSLSVVQSQVSTSILVIQPTSVSPYSSPVPSQPLGTSSVSSQTTLVVTPSQTSSVSPLQPLETPSVSSLITLVVTASQTSSVLLSQPLGTSSVSSQTTLIVTASQKRSVSPSQPLGTSSVLSNQTTLVVIASQTSFVSPSPSSSASLHSASSSKSSPSVATSVVTTVLVRVSSTVVISPSPTESQATPSSSKAVVTEAPPVYPNENMIIEFEGHCENVVGNAMVEAQFKAQFVEEVATKLGIEKSYIEVTNVECGSIKVTFTVAGVSGKKNVSQELKSLVEKGEIKVTVKGKTYKAKSIEVVQPTTTQAPTTKAPKNEIAFILYITFGSLMAVIFILGIVFLIVRCRKDRREGSFFLNQSTNYELSRFQGTQGARKYSKMNYYGEPVEHDAAAADPNAPDEFQAQTEGYPYNQGSSLDRVKPIAAANSDEKFNVGAMGLPEWKNLPKLNKSQVTRASNTMQDLPQSSGSVGSRNQLLGEDSESSAEDTKLGNGTSGTDSTPTNDNSHVLSFGDGTSDLVAGVNSKHAFDNPGLANDDSM